MHLDVIHTLPEMDALSEEWNTLLAQSAIHVPFLRHEYLTTWWRTLGGGEWSHAELYVVTARQEDGTLIGIAPLFLSENRQGEPALLLLGSIEISDYLDVIARPEHLLGFLTALIDHLISSGISAGRLLDWYNIIENSPTLPALEEIAKRRGSVFLKEPLQHCPYIPLPGDWESYLAMLDKKQRHEIRRKMRRATENYPPVSWYIVKEEADLDKEIDAFLELMAQDVKKKQFLTEVMRKQMRAAMRAAFRFGWLQLAFASVGGEKGAGYLNFDYQDHIWVYNSGINLRFLELSLGWVLLAHLLQWAIDNKRQAFDFMRGNEDYKYRFGAVDRHVMRAIVRC